MRRAEKRIKELYAEAEARYADSRDSRDEGMMYALDLAEQAIEAQEAEIEANLERLRHFRAGDRVVLDSWYYPVVEGLEGPEGALWLALIGSALRLFQIMPILEAAVKGGARIVALGDAGEETR